MDRIGTRTWVGLRPPKPVASERHEAFFPPVQKIVQVFEGFSVAYIFPAVKFLHRITGMRSKLEKLHQDADIMLENIINEHRENKRLGRSNSEGSEDDLVDVLLNLQSGDSFEFPLTIENTKVVMLDIFLDATETSTTVIEWAMSEMLKDSRVTKNGAGRDKAAPLLAPRECLEAVKIDGYEVPINTRVIINAWAIGRDSRHWNEAKKFYPERFQNNSIDFKGIDFECIPFGAGRRMSWCDI
ncbi:hypothetical protein JCGZ_00776 [Jatropha curcas]|uniref:Cytochrome P450 n=1 Tax=Jatropha curcas TaxID=180498 RepID=A0A067L4K0_JATCU|nr:hypothetical protein JCGZ_00776 [Jatropha curcas]